MANIQNINIGKLNVGMLAALEVLLRERSVSRAAQFAGLSQPAMSNALVRMREAFNDPLVVRGRKGMILTDRGEALLQSLSSVVPQLEVLGRAPTFDPTGAQMIFRLAATDHAALVIVPPLLRRISTYAPGITLQVTTVLSRQVDMDRLETSGFDLRLGWAESLPAHWHARTLFEERLVVMGSASNRKLAADAPVSLEAFLDLPHVVLSPDRTSGRNLAEAALAARGLTRRIGAYVSGFGQMPFIVAETDMIAIMPSRVASQFAALPGLVMQDSPFDFDRFSVEMAWHPRVHHDAAHRWLREQVLAISHSDFE